jgi:hypothetical protein
LEYENIELPRFPLVDRAKAWGINIRTVAGNYNYYGYYSLERQEIAVSSEEECVFFHGLSHCAPDIFKNGLKREKDPLQEIVAEQASHSLCRLVGKSEEKYLGNSFRYTSHYADKINLSPYRASTKVLNDVEQMLNLILNGKGNGNRRKSVDAVVA